MTINFSRCAKSMNTKCEKESGEVYHNTLGNCMKCCSFLESLMGLSGGSQSWVPRPAVSASPRELITNVDSQAPPQAHPPEILQPLRVKVCEHRNTEMT